VGRFDLIFCRNVLIYFSPESRRAVIQRLVKQHLDPAGYLLLGHAETVHDLRDRLRAVGPAICSPAAAPASRGVE
jgi:chemotaxis protein methyltransferase CheR